MSMIRNVAAALLVWVLLIATAQADGARVALIIGNATYTNANPLANPLNDAADLSAALAAAGFDVTEANDLTLDGMRDALKAFRTKANGSDIAMVFYAGHGLEVENRNYLVPVDADLQTGSDVLYDTIPLELLNDAVSGAKTLSLVILDACRSNPFAQRFADTSRSVGRGLSVIEPAAGTLVAYAARDGTIAADGDDRNSPYTRALLKYIAEPGLDVNLMFRKVRDHVMAETRNEQEPFVYGSLPGRAIYLVPPVDVASTEIAPLTAPVADSGKPPIGEEFAWALVKDTTNVTALSEFINAFPQGAHIDEAIARMQVISGPSSPGIELEPVTSGTTLDVPVPATEKQGTQVRETTVADIGIAPEINERELVTLVQTEMNRLGCNLGRPDGDWGPRSKNALGRYAKEKGLDVAVLEIGIPLLNDLKRQTGRICPLVCSVREEVSGDQCVLKTCPSGQRLSSKGVCYVPVAQPREEEDEEEAPVRRKPKITISIGDDGPPPSLCSLCGL